MLITPTVDNLKACLTQAELAAIPSGVLAQTSPDATSVDAWLGEKLAGAVARVIAACNSCSLNSLIPPDSGQVPESQLHTVLVLARHAVISCIPGMAETLEGSSRAAEYNTAVSDLSKLASCELRVDAEIDEAYTGRGMSVLTRPSFDFNWL